MKRAYAVKVYVTVDDDDFNGSVITDDIVQISNDFLRFAEEDHSGFIETRLAEVKPVPYE